MSFRPLAAPVVELCIPFGEIKDKAPNLWAMARLRATAGDLDRIGEWLPTDALIELYRGDLDDSQETCLEHRRECPLSSPMTVVRGSFPQ